jgi:hypothetical protein
VSTFSGELQKLNQANYALWLRGKLPPMAPEEPRPSEALALRRAFTVFEKVGTPETQRALKTLAETSPDGLAREEAKAALQRLDKRQAAGK